MNRPGARQSQRYWGRELPQLRDILQMVHSKCLQAQCTLAEGTILPEEQDHLQQCIVVGLQVLMPPMRGKPFYTLADQDEGANSMPLTLKSSMLPHFRPHISDFLRIADNSMTLVIRDQKTSRATGNYQCPVPELLRNLLLIWVTKVRVELIKDAGIQHNRVFFNLNTLKPFDQQGFSKYTTKAFKDITGLQVNLQLIRRIFTNGVLFG